MHIVLYIYTILWIINHHLKCTPKPILPIVSLNLSAPMTQEPLSQDTPVVVSQAEARGDGAFLYGILSKNDGFNGKIMGKSRKISSDTTDSTGLDENGDIIGINIWGSME